MGTGRYSYKWRGWPSYVKASAGDGRRSMFPFRSKISAAYLSPKILQAFCLRNPNDYEDVKYY
jgi:hypothetical protein